MSNTFATAHHLSYYEIMKEYNDSPCAHAVTYAVSDPDPSIYNTSDSSTKPDSNGPVINGSVEERSIDDDSYPEQFIDDDDSGPEHSIIDDNHIPSPHSELQALHNSDIRKLSPAERKNLQNSPRVHIYVGHHHHVATVPLPLLLAVSSKLRHKFKDIPEPYLNDLYKYHVQSAVGYEPIQHLVHWLKEILNPTKPVADALIPNGKTVKQDLLICRAAMSLVFDHCYYQHIFSTYWNMISRLEGDDFTAEVLELISLVDSIALGPEDLMFCHVVGTLASLMVDDKVKDLAALEEFLAGHEKLRKAVEEEVEKLGEEAVWVDSGD